MKSKEHKCKKIIESGGKKRNISIIGDYFDGWIWTLYLDNSALDVDFCPLCGKRLPV